MEKQWIRSERAHFMCPNMYFGILADIKAVAKMEGIEESLDRMAKVHPFLRSVIQSDKHNNLYYQIEERSKIELSEKNTLSSMWEDYEKLGLKEWNVLENGLLKVWVYPMEGNMKILFIAHHLLGDGRCLLELVNEFVQLYVKQIPPAKAPEQLIRDITDLPVHSDLPMVSKLLVRNLNRKWRKEKTSVTYEEYAKFSDQFAKENPVSYQVKAIDPPMLESMKAICKENQITLNDLLMAKTYLTTGTKKIIIAADIRNKVKCYQRGACGNYASAMGIMRKINTKDVYQLARDVHKQVKRNREDNKKLMLVLACYLTMEPSLIDTVAIATLGNFSSKAASFVGANLFGYQKRNGISITNLGCITNPNIRRATFIPPASPAAMQTVGVLTVNEQMQLCSSYYEKLISKEKVALLLEKLGQR